MIVPALLVAAVLTFSPQGSPLPGVVEWSVWIGSADTRTVPAAAVYAAASQIVPLTPAAVARIAQAQERRSPARVVLIGLEVAAWLGTTAQAIDRLKIRDKWQALAPGAASGLRFTSALVSRERRPPWQLPTNLLPEVLIVPAGGSVQYVIYGAKGGEVFSAEVE